MRERPLHSDRLSRAHDISSAVPRGNVFRTTEPVVAPVVTPPVADDPAFDRANPDRPDLDRADPPGIVHERRVAGIPERRRRFSIGASFLGWAVASFFSFAFGVAVLALLGGVAAETGDDGTITNADLTNLGLGAFVGLLVAMFLAYLIGGYAAGRIGHWDGAKHGALVPVWAILFGLLAFLGAAQIAAYVEPYANVTFDVDWGALGGYGLLALVLFLAVDFAGAILGGILGARGDQAYEGLDETGAAHTRRRAWRGRPL